MQAVVPRQEGVGVIEQRVRYNKKNPRYCSCCGAKMTWDRVTIYRGSTVLPLEHVKLCGACERAGRIPPEQEDPHHYCARGHDLAQTASRRDGSCKTCNKLEKDHKYTARQREERKANREAGFFVGPRITQDERVPAPSLRRYMNRAGYTGKTLAVEVGVSHRAINAWARTGGGAHPPKVALERIAKILQVPTCWLTEDANG